MDDELTPIQKVKRVGKVVYWILFLPALLIMLPLICKTMWIAVTIGIIVGAFKHCFSGGQSE